MRHRSGCAALLVLLIALGAAATTPQDWRRAVQDNDLDAIRRQLGASVDVDLSTERGKTALMAAARAGDGELAATLLAAGANPEARNRAGGTVLMYAVVGGNERLVQRLLAAGAAVDAQASNGWSALMLAAAKDRAAIARRLCRASADVNRADIYGWTPLMRAVYEGSEAVATVLLEQPGLQLERVNDHGQTALHLAVIRQSGSLVRRLLAHGARQSADVDGNTPRTIARKLGRLDLLALLETAPAQHQH